MPTDEQVFGQVPEKPSFPGLEEEILSFWKEIDAFKESLRQSKEENRPVYTFYDGPPFATGLPHYGHILAGTIKDTVTRYAHQTGHHVSRRFGWDCHGLPVEYEIDKKLGIKGTQDVEKMGIKKYNSECRAIVTRYCSEWESIVTRLGRWIDFKNDYKTMEPWYMESVWWVFKTIFEKGLVYQGFRVMPFSTACNTPLSNFEAGLNYKDVADPAVIVTFPLVEDPEVSFLAWTTTPWTLPSNLALCCHPTMTYVKIKDVASSKLFILAESRLVEMYPKMKKKGYKGGEYEVVEKYTGADLKGKKYEPILPYFKDHPNAFQVLNDEYVTDDSGVGIVHQAPAFGEDDYRVCVAAGIIVKGGELPCPVDANGRFTAEVTDFVGEHVKEADKAICTMLKESGRLYRKDIYRHSYPFCWRSDTPLIYKAVPSWFIAVEEIKEKLVENNTKTYWVPAFVKEKRFHNWLENARDWNVSRNRYWGTPLPIWQSEDGEETVCIGSIEELEKLSGTKVEDLHRENIDHLEIPSQQGKGMLKRITEVFDCWFESGSMPYAQQHYPFEQKEEFEKGFPADFIAEGLDQTRGWFYTLMVLSTALFEKPAFKNLIVNGLVLAEDGKKMSKRLKNYPDPSLVVNKYGADALRLYLINSPVVRAEPLKFTEIGVLGVVREVFLPWYNAFRFLLQNSERLERTAGIKFDRTSAESKSESSENIMDRWILAALHGLIDFVRKEMAAYRLYTVIPRLVKFIEQLTNWYVRLNRDRLKNAEGDVEDCTNSLSTLYTVLVNLSKLMAPFTPFFTEYMYQVLVVPENTVSRTLSSGSDVKAAVKSVHFEMIPTPNLDLLNKEMEEKMKYMQDIINLCRLARGNDLPLKRPIRELIIVHEDQKVLDTLKDVESYILAESNIKKITLSTDEKAWCKLSARADGRVLGKKLGKQFKAVLKAVQKLSHEELSKFQKDKVLEVEGVSLSTTDVLIQRTVIADEKKYRGQVSEDNISIILDIVEDDSLLEEWAAREVVNRVQKLRKNSGVAISDVLDVYIEVVKDDKKSATLEKQINNQKEFLVGRLKRPLLSMKALGTAVVVGSSEDEIDGTKLNLVLAKPSVIAGSDLKAGVQSLVESMDYDWMKENAKECVSVVLDGENVSLHRGKDYFLDAMELA